MIKGYAILLSVFVLVSCSKPVAILTTESPPGISIRTEIFKSVPSKEAGNSKILGKIRIENRSNYPIKHSNERLWLSTSNGYSRRTYVDSVASHIVDSGGVTIMPAEILELDVYWIFPNAVAQSLSEQELTVEIAL
jgi:hypothetical protein